MRLDENTPVDDPAPIRKDIFSQLEIVLNLDNYDPLPAQECSKFEYLNASNSFQVENLSGDNPTE